MSKTSIFYSVFLLTLYLSALKAQDYKLDPLTSKAIPTFQGTVLLIKGEARRFDKDHPEGVILDKGQRLFSGDKLETSARSMLKLQMTDQTIIALGPDSSFQIQKYEFQEIDKRKAWFHLARGQLRAVIYQKAKEGDLEFRTKSISMGVRGTEFLANEFENTEIALLTGKLLVTNLRDQKKDELSSAHYYLRTGQKTEVSAISQSEVTRLKAAHIVEEEAFRPFLDKGALRLSVGEQEAESLTVEQPLVENVSYPEEEQWKKVLEMLNRRLKENNYR